MLCISRCNLKIVISILKENVTTRFSNTLKFNCANWDPFDQILKYHTGLKYCIQHSSIEYDVHGIKSKLSERKRFVCDRCIFDPGRKIRSQFYCLYKAFLSLKRSGRSFTWAAPSEFGTYRLCEQRRFRRACASAQSRQNLRCSLIQAVSQEEPSDRKPDPWPL